MHPFDHDNYSFMQSADRTSHKLSLLQSQLNKIKGNGISSSGYRFGVDRVPQPGFQLVTSETTLDQVSESYFKLNLNALCTCL